MFRHVRNCAIFEHGNYESGSVRRQQFGVCKCAGIIRESLDDLPAYLWMRNFKSAEQ